MTYIFMDESGDLGFNLLKKRTTNYFIIGFLVCEDLRPIRHIVRNTLQSLRKNQKKKHFGTLHFCKESERLQKLFYKLLKENYKKYKNFKYSYILLDKNLYLKNSNMNKDQFFIYNNLVLKLLEVIYLNDNGNISNLNFIASFRDSSKYRQNKFKDFIYNGIKDKFNKDISIQIQKPYSQKGLQVIDGILWSLYQKYEISNTKFSDFIEELLEYRLFLNKF